MSYVQSNPNPLLHILLLKCDDTIEQISKSDYSDVCDTLKKFAITGKDLLELKEFEIRVKLANVNKKELQRFQSFVRDVQATPLKFFPLPSKKKSLTYHEINNKLKELREKFNNNKMDVKCATTFQIPYGYVVLDPAAKNQKDAVYEKAPIYKPSNEEIIQKEVEIKEISQENEKVVNPIDESQDGETYADLPPLNCELKLPSILMSSGDIYLEPIMPEAVTNKLLQHKFYRCVDRQKGRELLENTKTGSYLLRHSAEQEYLGALMINGIIKIKNVPICYNKQTNQYYCESDFEIKQMFGTLNDMLEYYTQNDINGDLLLKDAENHPPLRLD